MISPILRIACKMNVLHKAMQTISSPGTPAIFQTQMYLQLLRQIF